MSGFLLDTNIPSETLRPAPSSKVLGWLKNQRKDAQFVSVVTIGELRRGTTLLSHGLRRAKLEQLIGIDIPIWFGQRILPISSIHRRTMGLLDATCQLRGTPINTADGMIAATALDRGLTIVTRNAKDFARFGAAVLNLWE
jgi:toxin FitB